MFVKPFSIFDFTNVETWKVYIEFLKILGTLVVGIWAFIKWGNSRKLQTAQWLYALYRDFYFDQRYRDLRRILEYNYSDNLEPTVIMALNNQNEKLDDQQKSNLVDLDNLLNYLDFVAYLRKCGQIGKADVSVNFEWWLQQFADNKNFGSLCDYIRKFNFRHLAEIMVEFSNQKAKISYKMNRRRYSEVKRSNNYHFNRHKIS